MNLGDRIKTILWENNLKQKDFAAEIGVTESHISKLINDPKVGLSKSLAALIESKYGYSAKWILEGEEPKFRQFSEKGNLSELHQRALTKLEKMSEKQVVAVLAFINALEEVEKTFSENGEA